MTINDTDAQKKQGGDEPTPEQERERREAERTAAERMHLPTTMFGGYEYSPAEQGTEAFGGSDEAPAEPVDEALLRERVTAVLKDVYDPEIPVNIYDLGLIYGLEISEQGDLDVEMTLTAPACPVAGALVQEVAERVGQVEGVRRSHVTLVFDPPWTQDRMTEEAKLELGLF
ncbi:MAG: DUF59 domain-containing protein [Myxococcota bacterium]